MADNQATPETEHIAPHLVSDQSTPSDSLGFTPYVRAMATFLSHPSTTLPLTVSIEGEWGAGKTSFMRQLQSRLKQRGFSTVWFEPWRSGSSEGLWASLVLDCIQQLSKQRNPFTRAWLQLRLLLQRLKAGSAVFGLVRWFGKLAHVVAILAAVIVWWQIGADAVLGYLAGLTEPVQANSAVLEWSARLAPVVLGIIPALKELSSGASLLEVELKHYLKHPNYEAHKELQDRIRQDFKHVIDIYSGGKPIAVFVDDLDRCDPNSTVQTLQAINLVLGDDPRIVFIMGLDRETVAASHAAKYDKLLPFLASASVGADGHSTPADHGLAFGLSFLEKYITVPFRLPTLDERAIERFVDSMVPRDPFKHRRTRLLTRVRMWLIKLSWGPKFWHFRHARLEPGWPTTAEVDDPADYEFAVSAQVQKRRERLRVELYEDSDSVKEAVLMVAPVFDRNPRRLKQFLNLLRLRTFMAGETGLFDEVDQSLRLKGQKPLSLQQLAKLVAISQRWPGFLRALHNVPLGLTTMSRLAYEGGPSSSVPVTLQVWAENEKLMDLLRAGCLTSDGHVDPNLVAKFVLGDVDLEAFTTVSPQVLRRDGVIVRDRAWNYTAGSLAFWKQNRHKIGPIVRAVMRAEAEPDGYYLRLIDENANEMWFGGLNAGYSGEGPHGTLTVLVEAGFGNEDKLADVVFGQAAFELEKPRPPESPGLVIELNSPSQNS